MSNDVLQFGVLRNKKILNFKACEIKIFIYCMIKYKDTIIINLHHQICSKYFQLNHFSIVHVYAYREHDSECQAYYRDL